MKPKRQYKRYSREVVLDILRSYHLLGVPQSELARKHGLTASYVSQICAGESRPDLYAQVEAESAGQVG